MTPYGLKDKEQLASPVIAVKFLLRDSLAVFPAKAIAYVCLLVLAGMLETLATASMAPVLQVIGFGASEKPSGPVAKLASMLFGIDGLPNELWILATIFLVLMVLSQLTALTQTYFSSRLNSDYAEIWQIRQIKALLGAGWLFHARSRGSDAVNSLVNETNRLTGAFYHLAIIISALVTLCVYLTVSAFISWQATLAILFAGSAILFATRVLLKRAYLLGARLSDAFAALQADCTEVVSAIRLIKMTATEEKAEANLGRSVGAFKRLVFKSSFEGQLVRSTFEFFGTVMIFGLLILSPQLALDPATTLVLLALFIRLYPRFTSLQQSLHAFNVASSAVANVSALVREATESRERVSGNCTLPQLNERKGVSLHIRGLCYSIADKSILREISFDVPSGSVLGIAGGSGAGKSSLMDCLMALVAPEAGEVLVDGVPLNELSLLSWRRSVGYMGQEVFVFNSTIRQNLMWGCQAASQQEMEAAAKAAAIHDYILSQPLGYDSPVGERGVKLSGGERQRLGLARVLLQKPRLLILDEATSALDAVTEAAVMKSIQDLRGRTTILIVAHRLVSLSDTDEIIFMADGRVAERGTWESLISGAGSFAGYWRMQSGAN